MTGYEKITGYSDIKSMLKKSVQKDKIGHAYIFSGEAGSGKTLMAGMFAASILCEKHTGEACLECPACKKVLSRNHPDLIIVQHEKTASIGVDDIREQVVGDVQIRPFESEHKIYIIPEANLMTAQAQNAILKTLEEPPQYAVIMLLVENTDALLPTVLSRCSTVSFRPLPDETVRKYLEDELLVPASAASLYAALAMGKIGVAKKLARSDEFSERMNVSIHYLKGSKDVDAIRRIDMTRRLALNKAVINEYLDIFTIWFRDVLLFKATREKDDVIIKDELTAIKDRAAVSSYEGLQAILDAIDNARIRLKANVEPELVMELLLLVISEN